MFLFRKFPAAAVSLLALVVVAGALLSGCAPAASQSNDGIAPAPTAASFSSIANSIGTANTLVMNPVSDVVPYANEDLLALLDEVSRQQLFVYVQTLESFRTRNSFSEADNDVEGIGAARRWLLREFTRVGNGRIVVRFDDFVLDFGGIVTNQRNVVATLPGTDSSADAIVIMAHYDSRPADPTDGETRAPGANDNASGVALLLESARLLSTRTWAHDIIFVAFAAEEQGTAGSRNFAQSLFLNDRRVVAAINYDAVGGRADIPRSIRLFAQNLEQSPSGALARYYDYISSYYVPYFPLTVINALDREGRYGDHREFVNMGFPAVRLTESVEDPDLVNSGRDTYELVDYTYLEQVVRLNVSVIANMAGAPGKPETPVIIRLDTPGSFGLAWPVDPDAAGYAIAFRPFSSPVYPPFRYVSAAQAGMVGLTNFDPDETYAVSIAAVSPSGFLSVFSTEVVISPE